MLANALDLAGVDPVLDAPLVLLEAAVLRLLPPGADRETFLGRSPRQLLPPVADLVSAPDPVVPARLVVPVRLAEGAATFA